jgi:predicted RNase H-like nuclease (RuvC/YqgF family)
MAKNCINPNCNNEIPSSAVYCSYCGAQQISDGDLSEEEKLRKELRTASQTIKLLKKSLADAQEKIGKESSENKITELQEEFTTAQNIFRNQLINKNKEIEQLNLQIKKKNNNNGLVFIMIFFIVSTLIMGIISYNLNIKLNDMQSDYYLESNNNSNYVNEISSLNDKVATLEEENNNLQNKITDLNKKIPTYYKVISNADYYYKHRCDDFRETNCYVNSGAVVTIYKVEDGYGLSETGWLNMYYLAKY